MVGRVTYLVKYLKLVNLHLLRPFAALHG